MDLAASIIITTQNKATYLDLTLATLENQTLPAELWEVVVWDDRSNDETDAVLDKYEERARLNLVRRCSEGRLGSIVARNTALEIARGSIAVFLADDHLAPEEFLINHLKHHQNSCPVVVIGDTHRSIHTHVYALSESALAGCSPVPAIDTEDVNKGLDWNWLVEETGSNYQPVFDYFQRMNRSPAFPWIYFNSANASVPRATLMEINGFDAQYHSFGLEDYDLARFLHLAGVQFEYDPMACSLHQRHPKAAVDTRLLNADIYRFLRMHPDMNPLEKQLVWRGNYSL